MTALAQAIQDFFFHCQYEKNLTAKTLDAYRIDLEQFTNFLADSAPAPAVEQVDKLLLRSYLKHMMGLARPRTVKRKVATLRAFFNYLEFEDTITVSPFRKLRIKLVQEERLPLVLTLAEVRRLFAYLYNSHEQPENRTSPRQRLRIRDIAVIELLFATGMRVSELCNLNRMDIDLESGTVRIFGKGRRERMVPVCDERVLASLRKYLATCEQSPREDEGFFSGRAGKRITSQIVRMLVDKHALEAGITKKVTPHTFRHTIATLLLENGVDIRNIQQLLGHSSVTTTQIYAKVNTQAQRDLLARKHPRSLI